MSSAKRVLQKKRKFELPDTTNKNMAFKHKSQKKSSPEERIIIFVINSKEFFLRINSTYSLINTLKLLNFEIPYYIDEGHEIILHDNLAINDFFHLGKKNKIYNYNYYSYFTEKDFENQYEASQINLSTNLRELFYGQNYFCKLHLSSYLFLRFKNVEFNFCKFRDTVYNGKTIDVIEIFAKKGLGISTYLFLYFDKYRNKEYAIQRFIPFLIFNYKELKAAKTIDECIFLLNFAIVNSFVSYKEYSDYSTKVFNLVKKYGGEKIEDIIFQIIKDIKKIWIKNKYYYRPCIIIDKYSFLFDDNETFKNNLYTECLNIKFTLFIVYSLNEKKSNMVLYEYLTNKKPSNFMFSYTDILYTYIDKLPSKYQVVYSKVYPKITNFIKIENCINLDSANKIMIDEKEEIENDLNGFYPTKEIKEFYINQLIDLTDKSIDLKNSKDLFLNIPFEIFDYYEIKGEKGKIVLNLKSETAKEVLDDISNNSILQIIKTPLFKKLDNFIKGGLIERAIIQIIKNNKRPFGKFENIISIDCFLNKFKDKTYNFTKKEKEEKIIKLKYYLKLKNKYKNFLYEDKPVLFVPFLNNSKEWDIAFLMKNKEGEIELCLIQISINKPIIKIQKMMANFKNKKNYIKKKIKMIYGIKINYVNILFILSKQLQDKKTIHFLNKYNIPYIYFNNKKGIQNFLYKDNSEITDFELGLEYHFTTNKEIIEKCLNYKKNNNTEFDDFSAEDENIQNEDDEDDVDGSKITTSDIIYDQITN